MEDWPKQLLFLLLWSLCLIIPAASSIIAAKRSSVEVARLGALALLAIVALISFASGALGRDDSWCATKAALLGALPFIGVSMASIGYAPRLQKRPVVAGLITFVISVAFIPLWFLLLLLGACRFCHDCL